LFYKSRIGFFNIFFDRRFFRKARVSSNSIMQKWIKNNEFLKQDTWINIEDEPDHQAYVTGNISFFKKPFRKILILLNIPVTQ